MDTDELLVTVAALGAVYYLYTKKGNTFPPGDCANQDCVPSGYNKTPVFEDHFTSSLNTNIWDVWYGTYQIENSNIILGSTSGSGCIRTLNKYSFKHGYITYRAKLADTTNTGFCNQLWLAGDPPNLHSNYAELALTQTSTGATKLNIPESGITKMNCALYLDPTKCSAGTNTCKNNNDDDDCPGCCSSQCWLKAKEQRTVYNTGKDLGKDYHIYSCEWTPEFVRFLFDGKEVVKYTQCSPDKTMWLVAGLCKKMSTTDDLCAWGCYPASGTGSGTPKLYVDYIRIYQKN